MSMKNIKSLSALIVALLLPVFAWGLEVSGRIQSVSGKAGTIQLQDDKSQEVVVIRVDQNTRFENVKSIKELDAPDKVVIEFESGQPAARVKLVVVQVPEEWLIETKELAVLLNGKTPFTLYDARPAAKYDAGHLPGALSLPLDALKKNPSVLPQDKDQLLIFYCGGLTCPLSPSAAKIAQAEGHTNIRVYHGGDPAWRKARLPMMVQSEWLSKNLDAHHVILDVRSRAGEHLPGAVSLPLGELKRMSADFKANKTAWMFKNLPGVSDKSAPIIVYADRGFSPEAVGAYRELLGWSYGQVVVLEEGLTGWKALGLKTDVGSYASGITYVKKQVPGVVEPQEFSTLAKAGEAIVLDVRTAEEYSSAHVVKAVNIPLDELEGRLGELSRDAVILIHCGTGARASMAYTLLKSKGFNNVRFLDATLEIKKDGHFKVL
ncbi:MAG: rhodanese-like domain-containing protein [bacterium]